MSLIIIVRHFRIIPFTMEKVMKNKIPVVGLEIVECQSSYLLFTGQNVKKLVNLLCHFQKL